VVIARPSAILDLKALLEQKQRLDSMCSVKRRAE
jgi:hypothetical protein